MTTIRLQSSDGEIFKTDAQIIKFSGTIKTLLEEFLKDNEKGDVLPLPNVDAKILRRVLQWWNHHKDDPTRTNEITEECTVYISTWDETFFKVDQSTLFELILAANYLDIKGLSDVACMTVTNMIKGKSSEEIKKTFDIKMNFTSAEAEKSRKRKKK